MRLLLLHRFVPRRQVGGYDSRLPIMEDADLCLRLHMAGAPALPWRTHRWLSLAGALACVGCALQAAYQPAIWALSWGCALPLPPPLSPCRPCRPATESRPCCADTLAAQPQQRAAAGALGAAACHRSGAGKQSCPVGMAARLHVVQIDWQAQALHQLHLAPLSAALSPPAVVHAVIGLSWLLGASPLQLHTLYQRLYTDLYR